MPRSPSPAAATGLPKRKITTVERRAVMQAAHRTRKALGLTMGDALKQAWKQLRRHQEYRWPTDRLIMPHERIATSAPRPDAKRLYTRMSGKLAASFAA